MQHPSFKASAQGLLKVTPNRLQGSDSSNAKVHENQVISILMPSSC